MNKFNQKLDPNLTSEEKQVLWSTIKTRISGEVVTNLDKFRYKQWLYIFNYKGAVMGIIPWIIAGVIAFSGGTAVLADSANPGDALYTVDQKMEQWQEKWMLWNDGMKMRFHEKVSGERLAELESLRNLSPEELTVKAQELWTKHQAEAVERLEVHTAKIHELQVNFEEKFADAETEVAQERIQRMIDRLNRVEQHRTENLSKLSEKEFPGVEVIQGKLDKLEEWQNLSDEEKMELRGQMSVMQPEGFRAGKPLMKGSINS